MSEARNSGHNSDNTDLLGRRESAWLLREQLIIRGARAVKQEQRHSSKGSSVKSMRYSLDTSEVTDSLVLDK